METRRRFLKQSILATAGTMLVPNFLKALENPKAIARSSSDKILVVIQLSGGNDGLNTVVPYRNDLYYQFRPELAIPKEKVLKLSDDMGFHPALEKLKAVYDQGYLAVLNNVGYPNPDRSHFRSMDIWHTASNANEYLNTGWIGRYLDASCRDCNIAHQAIEIDDTLTLALKGESIKGMAVLHPKKVFDAVNHPFMKAIQHANQLNDVSDPALHYLYKTMAETTSSADYIYQKSKIYKSAVAYASNEFSNRLKTIAQLIQSDTGTRVYYVSLSGFDTHVRQAQQHEKLLATYAEGVSTFINDLESANKMDDVLVMTFSEFGRRVSQNASGGTDHGTANNLFIISKSLQKKGIINDTPNLSQLDAGDLIHQVDFRSIYATILHQWLEAPHEKILNGSFKLLDFI
jgi:uncharacterized protein (DUF1501 family)